MALASILARSDQECLLSELEALQNDSEITVSNKAEMQAVCGHLQTVRLFTCAVLATAITAISKPELTGHSGFCRWFHTRNLGTVLL